MLKGDQSNVPPIGQLETISNKFDVSGPLLRCDVGIGSEQVWQVPDMSLGFSLYAEKYARTVEYTIKLFPGTDASVELLNGA